MQALEALQIHGDSVAMEGIKEKSRPKYIKAWKSFKDVIDKNNELDTRMPNEDKILSYFRNLRKEKGKINL